MDSQPTPPVNPSTVQRNWLLIGLITVLVATNIATAAWLLINRLQGGPTITNQNPPDDFFPNPDGSIQQPVEEPGLKTDDTKGGITVKWNTWPTSIDVHTVIPPFTNQVIDASPLAAQNGITAQSYFEQIIAKKLGVIESGPFTGSEVVFMNLPCFGPCFYGNWQRAIVQRDDFGNATRLIQITKHSQTELYGIDRLLLVANSDLVIDNLETPKYIAIPNSTYRFVREEKESFLLLENLENPEKVFTYDGDHILYKNTKSGCYYAVAPDGTLREYHFDGIFEPTNGNLRDSSGTTGTSLNFTKLDGTKNTEEYSFKPLTGCGGFGYCYNYAAYISSTNTNQLEKVGTLANGEVLYRLKNTSQKANESDAQTVLETEYEGYKVGRAEFDQLSFQEFLAQEPLLFWQDPFGDFVALRNVKFLPAVECGKPVIYLYPQTPMDVSVQVAPAGGFSITIPEYNTGWNVFARPNGLLHNYSDGATYPYLFWEGKAIDYQRPTQGSVVAKSGVAQFLRTALSAQGLAINETEEFIAFWLPRMQEKPYYFVTFLPQSQFEQLAPLSVEPKPDTVIRVFMDFEGLDAPINTAQQHFVTPARNGFTVVEWGGALHR